MVAPAELAADLGIAARRQHLRQIHRHLTRAHHRAGAALARHLAAVDAVELADGALDLVDRDPAAIGRENVGQLLLGQLQGHFLPRQLGIGDQLVEAADQLADVAGDGAGEEIDHIARNFERGEFGQLGFEDRLPELDIGGLHIRDETHGEARKQARFDPVQRLGRAIGGKDQALALGQERVDRVEQFLLRGGLADDELDIVDEQQIEAAQARLELDHLVLLQRLDEFDHEAFGAAIEDAAARMGLEEAVADGVQEVGLALAGPRLEIERAELGPFGRGHALRCVAGEDIRFARNEGGEGQHRVEPDAGGEAGIADRVGGDRHHPGIGTVIGGAAAIGVDVQIGDLAAAGMHADPHIAHVRAGDFPCQRKAIGKAILHPFGGEFGGQEQVERPRVTVDAADLDRLDPLAVQLVTEILAQALADIAPVRRKIDSFEVFHVFVPTLLPFQSTLLRAVTCSTHRTRTRPVTGSALASGVQAPLKAFRQSFAPLRNRCPAGSPARSDCEAGRCAFARRGIVLSRSRSESQVGTRQKI